MGIYYPATTPILLLVSFLIVHLITVLVVTVIVVHSYSPYSTLSLVLSRVRPFTVLTVVDSSLPVIVKLIILGTLRLLVS
jgi:hypothetical protein